MNKNCMNCYDLSFLWVVAERSFYRHYCLWYWFWFWLLIFRSWHVQFCVCLYVDVQLPNSRAHPTILFFHGNAGSMFLWIFSMLFLLKTIAYHLISHVCSGVPFSVFFENFGRVVGGVILIPGEEDKKYFVSKSRTKTTLVNRSPASLYEFCCDAVLMSC